MMESGRFWPLEAEPEYPRSVPLPHADRKWKEDIVGRDCRLVLSQKLERKNVEHLLTLVCAI